MAVETPKQLKAEHIQKANSQICPECHAGMTAAEQSIENEVLFTWYKCSRPDCNGQWLTKEALNIEC